MQAYLGNAELKEKFLAEITKHEKADAIVQGHYGQGSGKGWKGCAVGCSLRSLEIATGQKTHDANSKNCYSDHGKYETMLGIPRVLARIEDRLFEGMETEDAKTWPRRFAEAIPVGADLSSVWPKFAAWMLADETDGVIKFANGRQDVIDAIKNVAAAYLEQSEGKTVDRERWVKLRSAAAAAAAAAADAAAAYAAYAAAAAAAAAYAAYTAAYAYADAYADAYAARCKHFKRMAGKLIEFLKEA